MKSERPLIVRVLIMAAMAVACLVMMGRIVVRYGSARIEVMAEQYDYQRDAWVERQRTMLTMFASVISARPDLVGDYDEAVAWLHEVKETHEDISVCYMVNLDWEIPVIMDNGWMPPEDYPIAERPWYTGARGAAGGIAVTEPYYDEQSGSYCCTFSQLVYDADGEELGIFAIDFYLDALVGIMSRSYSEEGYAFLTDSSGNIINHPNADYQMTEDHATNVSSTPYERALARQKVTAIRDYDGRLAVCYSINAGSRYYQVIAVQNWWDVYGAMVLACALLAVLFALCIGLIVVQSRRYVAMQQQTNEQLQEALEEARKANEAKTEFISRISHDIRTPIGAILNLTQFAQQDIDEPAKLKNDIDRIHSSGTFLLSLINDVLDISKVDSGRIELHPEPYDYREYLADLKNILEPMCHEKQITLEMEMKHTDRHYIIVDKIRLRQIALNILSNAVKYTPAGGTVRYSSNAVAAGGSNLLFTMVVEDTGIGMSEEFLKHVFDEFTQETDNPLRQKGMTGTGLGMSIVKKMVELMGGTIGIESRTGEGTKVTITLPVETIEDAAVEEMQAHLAQEAEGSVLPEGLRILLAEDNEINTEIALRVFETMGAAVDHACNGQEAVRLFTQSDTDEYRAIFMDIQMPVMDGYEAARQIRQLDRMDAAAVPIIAMTADAYTEAMEKAKEAGMNAFLTKPLEIDKIRKVLLELAEE